jgi:hypothetical protein
MQKQWNPLPVQFSEKGGEKQEARGTQDGLFFLQ